MGTQDFPLKLSNHNIYPLQRYKWAKRHNFGAMSSNQQHLCANICHPEEFGNVLIVGDNAAV
jgi:hypothetical protein